MARSLTPYNPFGDLVGLRDRLDRFFDDLGEGGGGAAQRLSVDVIDEDDRYLMRVDVPGVKPDDVKVELADDTLTVSASHEEEREEKEKNYVRRERRFGSFSRSMVVPKGVKPEDVEATMSDGVLEVSIPKPKPESERATAVEIKAKASSDD